MTAPMGQKGRLRKSAFWAILFSLVAYTALALSPLPRLLGRSNPSAAAWLSPPFFNFGAYYTSGRVMGFTLGASRREAAQVLSDNYLRVATFHSGCGMGITGLPFSILNFDTKERFWEWAQTKDFWCLRNRERGFSLDLDFESDKLKRIRVIVTNSEGP